MIIKEQDGALLNSDFIEYYFVVPGIVDGWELKYNLHGYDESSLVLGEYLYEGAARRALYELFDAFEQRKETYEVRCFTQEQQEFWEEQYKESGCRW